MDFPPSWDVLVSRAAWVAYQISHSFLLLFFPSLSVPGMVGGDGVCYIELSCSGVSCGLRSEVEVEVMVDSLGLSFRMDWYTKWLPIWCSFVIGFAT